MEVFFLGGYSESPVSGDKTSAKGGSDYWLIKIDSNGNKIWDKTYGGEDYDYLHSIERTDDNNFLLAGSSYSTIGGDKSMASIGANDIWLLKINPDGNVLWQKQYGGRGFDGLGSIKKTSDKGFILACNSSSWASADKSEPSRGFDDFWIIRIDANGNKIWDKTYGGNWEDKAFDLHVDSEGNSILAGWTESEKGHDVSEDLIGGYDIWLVKLDKNGNKLWDKRMGSDCTDIPATISNDSDGNIVVVGAICNDYWIYKFSECSESDKRKFCGDEDITLRAKNCTGTVNWSNGMSGMQITVHPTENTSYRATCTLNGNTSPQSNILSLEVTPHTSNLTGVATKSVFSSKTDITSSQIINNRVSYKAGNFIILGHGFKTGNSAVFETKIEGCSN